MHRLLKVGLLLFAATVVTRLAAKVVSMRFDEGSEVSDEFRRVIVFDGLEFTSRAGGLRSAEISVVMGGARIDLRNATIDPAGAIVMLENVLGGLELLVRDDWAVSVDDTILGGGENEVRVTPPTDLPDDAPRLTVQVITRLGSSVITTGKSRP